MAMTITEATAVNALLNWLLDLKEDVSWDRAADAAMTLAKSANKSLGAGVNAMIVSEHWTVENESGRLRRRRGSIASNRKSKG